MSQSALDYLTTCAKLCLTTMSRSKVKVVLVGGGGDSYGKPCMYEVKPISCEMPISLNLLASKCFDDTETFFGHEE